MGNYYVVSNTIGSTITVDGTDLVCGQSYAKKTNAKKDDDFVLAYHKDTEVVGNWIFDGQAILDYSEFYPDVTTKCREMAWRSAKIEIQSEIRPSKDTAKSVRKAECDAAKLDMQTRFDAGDINAEEFGKLAVELMNKYI